MDPNNKLSNEYTSKSAISSERALRAYQPSPVPSTHSGLSTSQTPFSGSNASSVQYPFSDSSASSVDYPEVRFSKLGNTRRYFHSRRVRKEDIDRPWTKTKDQRQKWGTLFPLFGIFIGLGLAGLLVWQGLLSIAQHEYCSVYHDDFSSGRLNEDIWTKEAEVGGYGNGQFEETTSTDENVFVNNGMLYMKPTLQDERLLEHSNIINLTALGTCTSNTWFNCVTSTNTTNGTIIQPVKSARINTKKGASIKYGKIEVVAKMPVGDWMWPAIWMLPEKDTYGQWPQSGEIDIVESRGNNHTNSMGGNNIVSSALHWGPDQSNDAWWRTNMRMHALHSTYASQFHTFGLEWSEKYLFTYIDSELLQVLYTKFDQPLWKRGNFPLADSNGTSFVDPWSQSGNDATPFDQPFYLIMNVAIGGTNGWFQDGRDGKPWVDQSPTAKHDFWKAKDQWYPTWKDDGQMIVKSVKMWQQKGYRGC